MATLTINCSSLNQTFTGVGTNIDVHDANNPNFLTAVDWLVQEAGLSIFRVGHDRMDWVAAEADIATLRAEAVAHSLDHGAAIPTLQRIYENNPSTIYTERLPKLWDTIARLNANGISGSQIIVNFMGWTPTWMGGSGQYNVVSAVTSSKNTSLATQIATLIYYGKVVKGLDFSYVSPFNEPDWNGLEGPQVDAAQNATICAALVGELNALGLTTFEIVSADCANSGNSSSYVTSIRGNSTANPRVNHYAFHGYGGSLSPGTSYSGKDYWATENAQWDSSLDTGGTPSTGWWQFAVDCTTLLTGTLNNGFPVVMIWEGIDGWYYHHNSISRWGLVSYSGSTASNHTGTYARRKSFYTYAHLAKYLRPGMRRVSVSSDSGLTMIAGYDGTARRLCITGYNSNAGSVSFTNATISNAGFTVSALKHYQTDSGSKNFTQQTDVAVSSGTFSVTIPGSTFFTLSFEAAGVALTGSSGGSSTTTATLTVIQGMAVPAALTPANGTGNPGWGVGDGVFPAAGGRVDWAVTVPTTGNYKFTTNLSAAGTGVAFIRVNGLPPSYDEYGADLYYTATSVAPKDLVWPLTAGGNIITLQSPLQARGFTLTSIVVAALGSTSALPATLTNATGVGTAATNGAYATGQYREWVVDAGLTSGTFTITPTIQSYAPGVATFTVNGADVSGAVNFGPSLTALEDEGEPMPASTLTTTPTASVSCASTAWTRLDSPTLTGRTSILVLNPDGADDLGIIFTASDTTPSAGTAAAYVIGASNDAREWRLTEAIRVWGKGIAGSGGDGTVAAKVTQFGN